MSGMLEYVATWSGKGKSIHLGLDRIPAWEQIGLTLHPFCRPAAEGWISAFSHPWFYIFDNSLSVSCNERCKEIMSCVYSSVCGLMGGSCSKTPFDLLCVFMCLRRLALLSTGYGFYLIPFSSSLSYSYRQRAQRLSEIHKDQPGHPVNRTVYWINYILRHNGAQHLRAAVYSISLYQYFLLDIAFVVLVGAALFYYSLAKLTKFIRKQGKHIWSNDEHSTVNGHYQNGIPNGKHRRNGHIKHE